MKKLFLLTVLFSHSVFSAQFHTQTLFQTEDVIWGFDFLPDGRILFTEREGALKLFNPRSKKIMSVSEVPEVSARGQGGLLDVLIDKDFSKNKKVFLTYSAPLKGGQATRLSSFTLDGNSLTNKKDLFTALPATSKTHHYGSRVLQEKSGRLFLTIGDRGERDLAQDKTKYRGKVISINQDGKYEVWSYGHRNAQGASFHPETKALWTVEHGPRGGDELNLITKGKNYGWPVITYGKEYWGPSIGEGTHKEGMEQPEFHYTPSIATSGLMIYSGKMFPAWKGSFFVGSLKDTHISRLVVSGNKLVEAEKLFKDKSERIRQIKESASGAIYYSTDTGKIILLKKLKSNG